MFGSLTKNAQSGGSVRERRVKTLQEKKQKNANLLALKAGLCYTLF